MIAAQMGRFLFHHATSTWTYMKEGTLFDKKKGEMKMKSFQYGNLLVGWLPAKEMQSGGRFAFFSSREEYEETFRKQQEQELQEKRVVYVETPEPKQSLDSLLADAGIYNGGKGRWQIKRRYGFGRGR